LGLKTNIVGFVLQKIKALIFSTGTNLDNRNLVSKKQNLFFVRRKVVSVLTPYGLIRTALDKK